ncbi:hypothetical protein ACFQ3L_08285 [Lacticaseibacillus jixianensis]|uniref:Prepilin type IV endopeptidase peptidase domain-containing protein n=1 Tax=Lacticaseibacillus jixianensis TaxID=2486012 RepID=A0ABW4BB61_9LACO|nr:hypothetical protein [Lacticaseibacillus jixianensis]
MLQLYYLAAATGLLVRLQPPRRQLFLQISLLLIGLFSFTQWLQAAAFLGLVYFGQWDLRLRAVPARRFDVWCVGVALLTPHPAWLIGAAWLLGLGVLAKLSEGMGSADVFAISVVTLGLPMQAGLIWVLLACLSGLVHYRLHAGPIPLLFHLELAYVVVQIMRW